MDYIGECLWMLTKKGFGPRFETRYDKTKHKQNLGIEALSTKTHVIVINIWKMNLRKKRKPYLSEDPHHTWYELNLEDEILVKRVECNIPEILNDLPCVIFRTNLKLFV
jgi:hypothetical protein